MAVWHGLERPLDRFLVRSRLFAVACDIVMCAPAILPSVFYSTAVAVVVVGHALGQRSAAH